MTEYKFGTRVIGFWGALHPQSTGRVVGYNESMGYEIDWDDGPPDFHEVKDRQPTEGSPICVYVDPYQPFGDFCRSRMGQQCQYGSRYVTGRIEGYPNLGEGLRFLKTDTGSYHDILIHRDDMDEFERRYRAYLEERMAR